MALVPPKVPLGIKALGLTLALFFGIAMRMNQDPIGRGELGQLIDALPVPVVGLGGVITMIWLNAFWNRHKAERARILADLARAELRLAGTALTYQTTRGAARECAYREIIKAEVSRPSDGARVLQIEAAGEPLRLTENRFDSPADFAAFHEALLARLSLT